MAGQSSLANLRRYSAVEVFHGEWYELYGILYLQFSEQRLVSSCQTEKP